MRSPEGYRLLGGALTEDLSARLAGAVAARLGVAEHDSSTPMSFTLGAALSVDGVDELFSGPVVAALREELGGEPALLAGVDTIAVNGSEEGFHRDSSYGLLPSAVGEDDPRYSVVRVLCYPSRDPRSRNVLRIVPGSHTVDADVDDVVQAAVDVQLTPTDVIVFDARCIHAGAPPQGSKTLLALTCGGHNVLSRETAEHEWRNLHEGGYRIEAADAVVDSLGRRLAVLGPPLAV